MAHEPHRSVHEGSSVNFVFVLRVNSSMSMDRPSLRRLFSACDVNKTGKIEYGDFAVVCRELSVPEAEVRTLFDEFDADERGYIDYSKFSCRFRQVSDTLDGGARGAGPSGSWEELVGRMDAECLLSER